MHVTTLAERQHPASYMPPLDGLRGLACLLVVFAHIIESAHLSLLNFKMVGSLGVLIFFSLSGFLMGALYIHEKCSEQNTVKYAASRVSRIFPGYYIAIVIHILSYLIVPGDFDVNVINVARLFMMVSSASVFWSIPPEIQFYGFFFLIWLSYDLAKKNKPALLYGVLALSMVCMLTRDYWPGLALPSKLHVFLFGFMASLLLQYAKAKRILCSPFFQAGIIAAVIFYIAYLLDYEAIYHDLFFAALVALGVFSLSQTSFITYIFTTRIFAFLGAASFSIYLFHGMILRVTNDAFIPLAEAGAPLLLGIAAIAVILPSIFHIYAERPLNSSMKKALLALYANHIKGHVDKFIARKIRGNA